MTSDEKSKIREAWNYCPFCSKSDDEIEDMILDEDAWGKMPYHHKCGWSKICQVAFSRKLQFSSEWKSLSRKRGRKNNMQSYFDLQYFWAEDFCETFKKVNDEPNSKYQIDNKKEISKITKIGFKKWSYIHKYYDQKGNMYISQVANNISLKLLKNKIINVYDVEDATSIIEIINKTEPEIFTQEIALKYSPKPNKSIKSVLGITPSEIDIPLIEIMYKWNREKRILSEYQVRKIINLINGDCKLNYHSRLVITNCLNILVQNGFR